MILQQNGNRSQIAYIIILPNEMCSMHKTLLSIEIEAPDRSQVKWIYSHFFR